MTFSLYSYCIMQLVAVQTRVTLSGPPDIMKRVVFSETPGALEGFFAQGEGAF